MVSASQKKNDFTKQLIDLVDACTDKINTAIPAQIVSFNDGFADIKPSISMVVNKQETEMPILYDIPVQFPQANGMSITFPVKEGDPCLLVFCQTDISNWYNDGHLSLNYTDRKFDINDAVCILGVNNKTNVISNINTENIEIRNEDASVKIEIANDGIAFHKDDNELVNLLLETIQLYIEHVHPESGVPADNAPKALLLKAKLEEFLIS